MTRRTFRRKTRSTLSYWWHLEDRRLLALTPVGAEFLVNTETLSDQQLPSTAMDADGDFVVVWESIDQDGDDWWIFGQRYAVDGTPARRPQGCRFARSNSCVAAATGRRHAVRL